MAYDPLKPVQYGETDNWYLFVIAARLAAAQNGTAPFFTTASGLIADDWDSVSQTIAGGGGFTPLFNAPATAVMILSAVALDLQRQGTGYTGAPSHVIPIPAGTSVTIAVKENAAEIGLRKTDLSAGAITVGTVYQK